MTVPDDVLFFRRSFFLSGPPEKQFAAEMVMLVIGVKDRH
jgi:hypothetical protein